MRGRFRLIQGATVALALGCVAQLAFLHESSLDRKVLLVCLVVNVGMCSFATFVLDHLPVQE